MPVKLYLTIIKVFLEFYKVRKLSSRLCEDVNRALLPICEKIEKGEYDYVKGDEQCQI